MSPQRPPSSSGAQGRARDSPYRFVQEAAAQAEADHNVGGADVKEGKALAQASIYAERAWAEGRRQRTFRPSEFLGPPPKPATSKPATRFHDSLAEQHRGIAGVAAMSKMNFRDLRKQAKATVDALDLQAWAASSRASSRSGFGTRATIAPCASLHLVASFAAMPYPFPKDDPLTDRRKSASRR